MTLLLEANNKVKQDSRIYYFTHYNALNLYTNEGIFSTNEGL